MRKEISLYDRYILPFEDRFKKLEISLKEKNKLENFVLKVIDKKSSEDLYQEDGYRLYKRYYTGFLSELVLGKFFKKEFIDWSIGNSEKYNKGDISIDGVEIGVKASEKGNFPLVSKYVERPEIICIKLSDISVCLKKKGKLYSLPFFYSV